MEITINLPGEKLVIKLWETITDKGIGCLLKPLQIKREGKALAEVQAEAMKIIAQAERDVEEIKLGKGTFIEGNFLPHSYIGTNTNQQNQTNKIEPYIDTNNLSQLVVTNSIKDAIRKEINVSKSLLIAESSLAGDSQEPSEGQVNEDWLYRWRDYAGDVSMEELQSLWGNLLAGEVKSPGKFSLRTLEFLRNLSKDDASKIETLATYLFKAMIYSRDEKLLTSKGITFEFLLDMQELGIVSGIETTGIITTYSSSSQDNFYLTLDYRNKALQISHENAQKTLTLQGYSVTNLGNQVFSLGNFNIDENYLETIGRNIKGQGFAVDIVDRVELNNKLTKYTNRRHL